MGSWRITLFLFAATVAARIASASSDPSAYTSWAIDFGTGGTIPSADDDSLVAQNVYTGPAYSTSDPATGDFYLSGTFEYAQSLALGSYTVQGASDYGNYLVKISRDGEVMWAYCLDQQQSTTYETGIQSLAYGNGVLYASGKFKNTAAYPGLNPPLTGNSMNIVVLKIDPSTGNATTGAVIPSGMTYGLDSYGIAVNTNGNSAVVGRYVGSITPPGSQALSCPSNICGFIVLFNSDLTTVTFATSVSSTITVFVTAVVLNDDGSFFVAGSFTGTSLTIGATVVLEPEVSGGSNDYNNFLAKFDSAGNVAYVKLLGTTTADKFMSQSCHLAMDHASGSLFLTARFEGPSTLKASDSVSVTTDSTYTSNLAFVKYDASTGDAMYIKKVDGQLFSGQTVLSSAREVVWLATSASFSTVTFAGNEYVASRNRALALAYHFDGTELVGQMYGSSSGGAVYGYNVAVDDNTGNVTMAGDFYGDLDAGSAGVLPNTNDDGEDVYKVYVLQFEGPPYVPPAPTPGPDASSPVEFVASDQVCGPEVSLLRRRELTQGRTSDADQRALSEDWTPDSCYYACRDRLNDAPSFLINIYFDETLGEEVCTCCRNCEGWRYVPSAVLYAHCAAGSGGSASLSVNTAMAPRKARPGKLLRYRAKLRNADKGGVLADIAFGLQLPPGVSYQQSSSSANFHVIMPGGVGKKPRYGKTGNVLASFNATAGTLTWSGFTIPPRKTIKISTKVRINSNVPRGASLFFGGWAYQQLPVNGLSYCQSAYINQTVWVV